MSNVPWSFIWWVWQLSAVTLLIRRRSEPLLMWTLYKSEVGVISPVPLSTASISRGWSEQASPMFCSFANTEILSSSNKTTLAELLPTPCHRRVLSGRQTVGPHEMVYDNTQYRTLNQLGIQSTLMITVGGTRPKLQKAIPAQPTYLTSSERENWHGDSS